MDGSGVNIVVGGLALMLATMVLLSYLLFIWWLDRYEREPLWMVAGVFLWGGLGGTCFGCFINSTISAVSLSVLGSTANAVFTTVFVAPPVEELTKGAVLVVLVLSRHFDNETDGLIYGAAAGLGFAVVENIWYFINHMNAPLATLFGMIAIRTLFTAIVHCVSSALLGMSVGYARHRSGTFRWILFPGIGYTLAVLNHATWNGIATASGFLGESDASAGVLLIGMAMVVVAAITMFGITQLALKREHDVIRRYLEQEAQRGVLPMEHAAMIPYWLKRRKIQLPPHVDREDYIRAATLLAFRHYQLEISEGERRNRYLEDIARFRHEIQQMLGTHA